MNNKLRYKPFIEAVFSISTVLIFEILHIFWQDAGKVIISSDNGAILPVSLIFNLLYFVFFYVVLMCLSDYMQGKKAKRVHKERLLTLLLLVYAQLMFDLIRFYAVNEFSNSSMIVDDIFTFLSAVATLFILEKRMIHAIETDKRIIIPIVIIFILLAAALVCDLSAAKAVSSEIIKHAPYEARLRRIVQNAEFRFWLRNAMLDGGVFSVYLIWLSAVSFRKQESASVLKETGIMVMRLLVLSAAVFLLQTVKLVTYSQGSISTTAIFSGPSECTQNGFYVNKKIFKIIRIQNKEETAVYYGGKIDIYQRDKKIVTFRCDGNYTAALSTGHNIYNEQWYEKNISGIDVQIIANRIVLWDCALGTQCVDLKKNDKYIQDRSFNGVCEAAISDGYLEFFDYVCEYMVKYDREFIKPYIARYSAGDFTEAERELNRHLNLDYVATVAAQYIPML